jgi:hypothetical protein
MRKQIYMAVIARMKQQVPAVQHISLWNENMEHLEQENGYCLPAVFVEFEPMKWKQVGLGAKTATLCLLLHVVTETLADPSDGSQYQDDALEVFGIINDVVYAITGLSGECFNRLMHVETIPDHNHAQIQHDVEVFICEVSDTSQLNKRASIPPESVKVTGEYQ